MVREGGDGNNLRSSSMITMLPRSVCKLWSQNGVGPGVFRIQGRGEDDATNSD